MGQVDWVQGRLNDSIRNLEKAWNWIHGIYGLPGSSVCLPVYAPVCEPLPLWTAHWRGSPGCYFSGTPARLVLDWRADPKPLHDIFHALAKENPATAVNASHVLVGSRPVRT